MSVVHTKSADMPSDRSAIEVDGFTATVATFRGRPDPPGKWHHHGEHHVIAYLIWGKVTIETGPGGSVVIEPMPGDLVHIEPGTVHRETYEGEVSIAGFSVGTGPGRVDVEGPE